MRKIAIRQFDPQDPTGSGLTGKTQLTTLGVMEQVCSTPSNSGNGVNVNDIRQRIKILDAAEDAAKAGADHFELEDAQWETLCNMVNGFSFAIAHRDLLTIIDDILNAEPVKPN